jgi:hypothetical protein
MEISQKDLGDVGAVNASIGGYGSIEATVADRIVTIEAESTSPWARVKALREMVDVPSPPDLLRRYSLPVNSLTSSDGSKLTLPKIYERGNASLDDGMDRASMHTVLKPPGRR